MLFKKFTFTNIIIKNLIFILFSLLIILTGSLLAKNTKSNVKINWQTISAGGIQSSSANYGLVGSVEQAMMGINTSTNYNLNANFWQKFGTGDCCVGIRGNVDGDSQNKININDIIYLINFDFLGGPPPKCFEEADVNGDGDNPNSNDILYLINYAFKNGPPPVACP